MATAIFMLLTLQFVMLNGSKPTVRSVYRPYGPKMCESLCKESADTFVFLKEDLSCHRIPAECKISDNNGMSCPKNSISVARDVCDKDSAEKTTKKDQSTTVTSLIPVGTRKQGERMVSLPNLNQAQTTAADYLENLHTDQNTHNIALHEACEKGNLSIVKYILSRGLEVINCRGKLGRTPVMAAVRNGQARVFDYLTKQGCDLLCIDDHKNNVLHIACVGGNIHIVRTILGTGKFYIDGRGLHGKTPLMWAVEYGHGDVCRLLIKKKSNMAVVDDFNNNLLHLACISGDVDMVTYVLSKNIDIESRGRVGRTPVIEAAIEGHRGVVIFLEFRGCNLKAVDDNNDNILHAACVGGHVDMVSYILLGKIFDIDTRGHKGRTPVMVAVLMGDRGVFDFLVRQGCNLKVVDDCNSNVLHLSCAFGHVDMVKYLLTIKAVEGMLKLEDTYGLTPIQVAERKGRRAVVSILRDWK